jgi:hypothetical protein
MPVFRNWDLSLDVDMVLRGQGADPARLRERRSGAVAIAEQAVAAGAGLLQPAVVSETFAVGEFRHNQLRLAGGGHLAGPLVAQHLHAAQSVVVAVCTIGPALEAATSERFADDPAFSVALDAFGSAAVELLAATMCQRADDQALAEGLLTTIALTPGLVGWPLAAGQRELFALVDAASVGVSLTEGYLMMPQKSTSLVIGIGADVERTGETCDYCSMATTCRHREGHAALHA